MKHGLIGGGNIGALMAAELAAQGHEVVIYTSDPEKWSESIQIVDGDGNTVEESCAVEATSSLAHAVGGSAYIWITYPTSLFGEIAERLLPLVCSGQRIGIVPGACAEFFFQPLIEKGCTLFGFQRVHSVARTVERGHVVAMLGRKASLQIASIPADQSEAIAKDVEQFFKMPTSPLPNYLALTLVPSNPILHTARIATMFGDWGPGTTYPRNMLFYEDWTDEASRLMLQCDDELQTLCDSVPLDLSDVTSLRTHYESATAEAMTQKISHIPAFKGLLSPMRQLQNGQWEPDFQSRYFSADFAFGLEAICQIAELAHVDSPNMHSILDWYHRVSGNPAAFTLPVRDFRQLLSLYQTKSPLPKKTR